MKTRLIDKCFVIRMGMADGSGCRVSVDHPSCNYGNAVLIEDFTKQALGPGDIVGGMVQCPPKFEALLTSSGFTVVESIEEAKAMAAAILAE